MAFVNITTADEFEKEVKQAKGLVLVDFWAPWCGPCKMMAPVLEAIEGDEAYKEVKFVKADVDEASELASANNIISIPTLQLYKDGEKIDEKPGAMNKDQLKEFLDKGK